MRSPKRYASWLAANWNDWHQLKRGYSKVGEEIAQTLNPAYSAYLDVRHNNRRVDITNEDWDNLIILDACRFDLFEEANTINGELDWRLSRGSATPEFIEANFSDGYYEDIVYIVGIPQVHIVFEDHPFVSMFDVWEEGWDHKANTVRPESMKEATLRASEQYPNKRIISHWVQPHWPFIGPTAATKLPDQLGVQRSRIKARHGENAAGSDYPPSVWGYLRNGDVSRDEVWNMYRENLELALPHVEDTLAELRGKSVVTSDHGNVLGELAWPYPVPIHGHPIGVHANSLIKVPWLVVNKGQRKRITAAPKNQTTGDKIDTDTVSERLADLGYRE
jgi:hypothetical protein